MSCYGKLPVTGDFIRYQATSSENATFDTWLQGSINLARQTLGDGFSPAFESSVGIFIYRGEPAEEGGEPERGMLGVWAASGDSAGRRYPMRVSVSFDYEQLLAVGPGLPIAAWPFLVEAYDLVVNGRGLSVEQFLGRVAQLQPPPLDDPAAAGAHYREWLGQHSMKALWETGFGGVEARYHVLQLIHASVEFFQGQERPQTSLAIRFPLGAGDAYAASVWTDMTIRLARWQRTLPNVFWTPQQYLMLHIGPPHVATFRELIASSGDADHVTDLTRPSTAGEGAARSALGPLAGLVDNVDLSIERFLAGLSG